MTAWFQRALEGFKNGSFRFGRAVQRWIVTVLLLVLYIVGMGLTKLLCVLFFRDHLKMYRTDRSAQSFWKDVEPYTPDAETLRRQF